MSLYHVEFTRQISEDLPVIADKGRMAGVQAFTDQIAEEFAPHLSEDMSLQMGGTYQKDDNGDNYVLEGFFTIPQTDIDPSDKDVWEKRHTHLEEFLTLMTAAYEDGVAGFYRVVSVEIGSGVFPASEIVDKAKSERLSKGTDLLDLSAEEVFDRTKRQNGDVAMITSGEFDGDGIHQNNTAYAVGRISDIGLFEPIKAHLRFGDAVKLFDETCSFAVSSPSAGG